MHGGAELVEEDDDDDEDCWLDELDVFVCDGVELPVIPELLDDVVDEPLMVDPEAPPLAPPELSPPPPPPPAELDDPPPPPPPWDVALESDWLLAPEELPPFWELPPWFGSPSGFADPLSQAAATMDTTATVTIEVTRRFIRKHSSACP